MNLLGLAALAAGLVLVVEGLILALAPGRIDRLIEAVRQMPVENRRWLGLGAMTAGAILIWLAGLAGG
jgi:hypothetical protein